MRGGRRVPTRGHCSRDARSEVEDTLMDRVVQHHRAGGFSRGRSAGRWRWLEGTRTEMCCLLLSEPATGSRMPSMSDRGRGHEGTMKQMVWQQRVGSSAHEPTNYGGCWLRQVTHFQRTDSSRSGRSAVNGGVIGNAEVMPKRSEDKDEWQAGRFLLGVLVKEPTGEKAFAATGRSSAVCLGALVTGICVVMESATGLEGPAAAPWDPAVPG